MPRGSDKPASYHSRSTRRSNAAPYLPEQNNEPCRRQGGYTRTRIIDASNLRKVISQQTTVDCKLND
jgi:hypothetical protein